MFNLFKKSESVELKEAHSLQPFKSIPLKIKMLNLAAEVRIIKNEERRILGYINKLPLNEKGEYKNISHFYAHNATLCDIKLHRQGVVSAEARDTLLAYGFLRGRTYKQMESKRYSDPGWNNIERMILKYGKEKEHKLKQSFEQWKQAAGEVDKR